MLSSMVVDESTKQEGLFIPRVCSNHRPPRTFSAHGSLRPPTQISVRISYDSVRGASLQIYTVMSLLKMSFVILPSASVAFIALGVSEPSLRGPQSSHVFSLPRQQNSKVGTHES